MRNGFILNATAVVLLIFVTAMLLLWPRLEPNGEEGTMYHPQTGTTQDALAPSYDPEPSTDPTPTSGGRLPDTTDPEGDPDRPQYPTASPETTPTTDPAEEETIVPPPTQPTVDQDGYYNEVIKP